MVGERAGMVIGVGMSFIYPYKNLRPFLGYLHLKIKAKLLETLSKAHNLFKNI